MPFSKLSSYSFLSHISLQMALLISVIKTCATKPQWKDVPLPEGRTIRAAQQMYDKMVSSSKGVKLASSEDVPDSPRRGRNAGGKGATNGKKRKAASDSDEDEEQHGKAGRGTKKAKAGVQVVVKKAPVEEIGDFDEIVKHEQMESDAQEEGV